MKGEKKDIGIQKGVGGKKTAKKSTNSIFHARYFAQLSFSFHRKMQEGERAKKKEKNLLDLSIHSAGPRSFPPSFPPLSFEGVSEAFIPPEKAISRQ